jgi:hypothetical protein
MFIIYLVVVIDFELLAAYTNKLYTQSYFIFKVSATIEQKVKLSL